jgi:hypothetical protein
MLTCLNKNTSRESHAWVAAARRISGSKHVGLTLDRKRGGGSCIVSFVKLGEGGPHSRLTSVMRNL